MLRTSSRLLLLLALPLLASSVAVGAAPSTVPPSLAPWIPWVLRDVGDESCPQGRCLALSGIAMDVRGARADFVLTGWRWSRGVVELPGDSSLWPEGVRDASGAVPVIASGDAPAVLLEPGPFRLAGTIRWTRRPASIELPDGAALEVLSVDGSAVASSDGELWLRKEGAAEGEVVDTAGSIELRVFRTVTDGIPVRLETRLVLAVSGKSRRIDLPAVLPTGALPVELESPLPAQLSREGRLSITASPGTWEILVSSVWLKPPATFPASSAASPWPEHEVWSFGAEPSVRTVQIEGGVPIDARQAGVAPHRQSLPAWSVPRGGKLEVRQILRGDPMTDSVKMALRRSVWIDFGGDSATVLDELEGEVLKPVRLSASKGLELGRATVDGDGVVLTSAAPGEQGFPLVSGHRSIRLVSRWEHGAWSVLPATTAQWEHISGRMDVRVGPGWRLLDLLGPGSSYGTWASEWNLWSIFLVVLASSLVARLAGKRVGVLAAFLFVLGASDGIATGWWVHLALALLVWTLVRSKFPGSKPEIFLRAWSGIAALAVVFVLIPFTIEQMRFAVHPSLSASDAGTRYDMMEFGMTKQEEAAPEMEVRTAPAAPAEAMQNSVMDKIQTSDGLLGEEAGPDGIDAVLAGGAKVASGGGKASLSGALSYGRSRQREAKRMDDPTLLGGVQSGPGEPTWDYGSGVLTWEGPVSPTQGVRILALSPGWVRLWRVLIVVGAWLLAWLLARAVLPEVAGFRPRFGRKPSVAAMVLLLAAGARSEIPSEQMLGQLKAELLRAKSCGGPCARVGEARLAVRGSNAILELEVHAAARSEVGLPEASWIPRSLVVPRGAAGRDADGGTWAVVEPGIQTIRMEGVVRGNELLLSFPGGSVPFRRRIEAPGWNREGDDPGSVRLTRASSVAKEDAPRGEDSSQAELVPLVAITRVLDLGREWTMTTRIERASGFQGAVALDVPLVAGETVLGSLAVDSLRAKVVLNPGQRELSWNSRLPVGPRIFLKAESTSLWTETWVVESAARWHVATTGSPRVQAGRPTWMPLGGETLSVAVEAPKPIEGAMFTIESARMEIDAGQGTSRVELSAKVLAGIGGEIFAKLPEGARVSSASVRGVQVNPVRSADGRYRITVAPGISEVELVWLQEGIGRFVRRAPEVSLSAAGTNVVVGLAEPSSGWIIATGGEGVGPAVLWWGVIASMILLAGILSRIPGQPLGFGSWFLLFLGTSTVGKLAVIPFVVWVVVFLLRSRAKPERWSPMVFTLVQSGAILVALVAWGSLLASIPRGLLGRPDMLVETPLGGYAWFVDRIDGTLPRPWQFVLPLWLWRLLLLIWCLWLVRASIGWGKWGWEAFTEGGIWPAKAEAAKAPGAARPVPEADASPAAAAERDEAAEEESKER